MNIPIYTSNPTTTEYQILERKNLIIWKVKKKKKKKNQLLRLKKEKEFYIKVEMTSLARLWKKDNKRQIWGYIVSHKSLEGK